MGKAPCCSKVGLHKGPWSTKEDMMLTNYIQTHGEGLWRSMPKKAGLLRCGKSCRLRWMNYLRPGIKRGNITADEEDLIIRLHKLLGNRWSLIAGRLPGRTDNEIKNYWNTHLMKKLKKSGMLDERKVVSKNGKNNGSKKKGSQKEKQQDTKIENDGELKCIEDVKKTEVLVPKPIRVFSGSSSIGSVDTALSSSSSQEVKGEVKLEMPILPSSSNSSENISEKMCSFTDWELCLLGDVNFDQICSEGDDQVLKDGCPILHEDSMMPSISNMMERVYDEYLQLL